MLKLTMLSNSSLRESQPEAQPHATSKNDQIKTYLKGELFELKRVHRRIKDSTARLNEAYDKLQK